MSYFKKFCRLCISIYFRVFVGKISFEVTDFMDAWGSSTITEYKAVARGRVVGYNAYRSWMVGYFMTYTGQNLHKWCYEYSWGWKND